MEAGAKERVWVASPQWPAWGAVGDRNKAEAPWQLHVPVCVGGLTVKSFPVGRAKDSVTLKGQFADDLCSRVVRAGLGNSKQN